VEKPISHECLGELECRFAPNDILPVDRSNRIAAFSPLMTPFSFVASSGNRHYNALNEKGFNSIHYGTDINCHNQETISKVLFPLKKCRQVFLSCSPVVAKTGLSVPVSEFSPERARESPSNADSTSSP
jgi:hypothetical protein